MNKEIYQALSNINYTSSVYKSRIDEEIELFEPFFQLERLVELKNEGHLFIPSNSELSNSLILHILGLNPIDPIKFNLPVPALKGDEKSPMKLEFYSNIEATQISTGLSLEPLKLLTDLKVVLYYLNETLDGLTQKAIHIENLILVIEKVFTDENFRKNSLYFNAQVVKELEPFKNHQFTSFQEWVECVDSVYSKVHSFANNEFVRIYMDMLLMAWIRFLNQVTKKY
jgi:hypothetical protein